MTTSGRLFQTRAAATGKASVTDRRADRRTDGTDCNNASQLQTIKNCKNAGYRERIARSVVQSIVGGNRDILTLVDVTGRLTLPDEATMAGLLNATKEYRR